MHEVGWIAWFGWFCLNFHQGKDMKREEPLASFFADLSLAEHFQTPCPNIQGTGANWVLAHPAVSGHLETSQPKAIIWPNSILWHFIEECSSGSLFSTCKTYFCDHFWWGMRNCWWIVSLSSNLPLLWDSNRIEGELIIFTNSFKGCVFKLLFLLSSPPLMSTIIVHTALDSSLV